MRKAVLVLAVFLPQPLKRFVYGRVMGWRIGAGVRIGLSYIEGREVVLGDDVRIGHFNIIRAVRRFAVGRGTRIENFNHIFGPSQAHAGFEAELLIGEDVYFMSRHFVDVAGKVFIGNRVVIGGRDTQIWSHALHLVAGQRSLDPLCVRIGDDVYIGARATLLGCSIPDGSVVGAGGVVTKSFPPEPYRLLIAGNPAVIKKRYDAPAAEPPWQEASRR